MRSSIWSHRDKFYHRRCLTCGCEIETTCETQHYCSRECIAAAAEKAARSAVRQDAEVAR